MCRRKYFCYVNTNVVKVRILIYSHTLSCGGYSGASEWLKCFHNSQREVMLEVQPLSLTSSSQRLHHNIANCLKFKTRVHVKNKFCLNWHYVWTWYTVDWWGIPWSYHYLRLLLSLQTNGFVLNTQSVTKNVLSVYIETT